MKRAALVLALALLATPAEAQLLSDAQKERILDRLTSRVEAGFASEVEAHPERAAPAAWVYQDPDGGMQGDAGMSLSLFARPSKLSWMRGRWVTLGVFAGKSTAGVGLAWELTPHRVMVDGERQGMEIWAGPVAVTPWGDAGELRLSLGLGMAVRF